MYSGLALGWCWWCRCTGCHTWGVLSWTFFFSFFSKWRSRCLGLPPPLLAREGAQRWRSTLLPLPFPSCACLCPASSLNMCWVPHVPAQGRVPIRGACGSQEALWIVTWVSPPQFLSSHWNKVHHNEDWWVGTSCWPESHFKVGFKINESNMLRELTYA